MESYTTEEIADVVGGELRGESDIIISDLTTDSRNGGSQSIFVAIKGERFDGNDFAEGFLENGAAVLVDREVKVPGKKAAIIVEDTRKALCTLARNYRERFKIPVIGVTGSVGKTSTKDMIASVLSQGFNTLKNQGNFNNDIGLPLTVFNLTRQHEAAVLEMGMSNFGEISLLTSIAQPRIAVLTNIGTAHIGNLGSQQNILKAKLEILEKLEPGGIVVLNADDKILYSLKGKLPHTMIYYGIDNQKADVIATDIILGNDKSKFRVEISGSLYCFEVNEIGQHHIYNALAAVIIGMYFKMDVNDIIRGVSNFSTQGMRQKIEKIGGITLIEDCYNASATSMEAALKVLSQVGGANRKIAVLGDILEQGRFAEREHRYVGECVAKFEINKLVTVGSDAKYIAEQSISLGVSDVVSFDTNSEALKYLKSDLKPGDTVLFKASRGMKLEEISTGVKEFLK